MSLIIACFAKLSRCHYLLVIPVVAFLHALCLLLTLHLTQNCSQTSPTFAASDVDNTTSFILTGTRHTEHLLYDQLADIGPLPRQINDELVILVWNTKNSAWNQLVNFTIDDRSSAKRSCRYTIDRKRLNYSVGVLFYGDLMHLSQFPTPESRPRWQKWIYLSVETPINTVHTGIKQVRLQRQRHHYNVTSTYSLKSDVPIPYYDSICHTDDTTRENFTADVRQSISNKRRLIAWFVSHCQTNSRREQYVEQLRQHVPVDVYGRCGQLECSRVVANSSDNYYTACDDMVARQYKFYLAFENSLCHEYVTEKFFRFLHRDVIAIALGAANYSQFVPRGTYIDVRDFRSPTDLASYLKLLDSNDDLYEEYLIRKRRLVCKPRWAENHQTRLCRHLYETLNTTRITDLSSTVDAHQVCLTARKFYRHVADSITH